MSSQPPARRTVLRGAALASVAGLGVAACSPDGGQASAVPTAPVDLGSAEEIPVGGTKVYREDRVLVTRVAKDEYKAFSAVCTHRQCVLNGLRDDEATCSCHGSAFDVRTGEVRQGPATQALPAVPVRTKGGKLVVGPEA
ncbi:ubiquinol-cytochrome c reductase iron-sulfur subunit [Streptomyces palmae]|uniref:Cytochrome bc1 complex Rieske iron-sulfur subunit n=1 Tax=Streptomyces palmae TaxID=1701085 RepID=A0A4Z0H6Y7_9ACTN|nr:Rieske (2Fe-2S) protein [Streptomyces palmae]TGB09001.1 Rieske (2Fe-2S) protein [Streptomyces palmae]